MNKNQNKLGEILIKRKFITREQLDSALAKKSKKPIGEVLVGLGFVTEKEISQALTDQTIAQKIQENLGAAVRNPAQYKVLWFVVVFSIAGIGFLYNILGSTDEKTEGSIATNIVQDEDINAVKNKEKKLRLRYIGHDSKLNEQQDTIKSIKNRASNFKSDVNAEFKGTYSEIEDLRILMFENDSTLNDELSELDDRFFTYRSTSKNNIDRLKKENKALKARIDDLEIKINQLEALNKEKSE